jgi:hypothetical protein
MKKPTGKHLDLNVLAAAIVDAATNDDHPQEVKPKKTKPPWSWGDLVE